MLTLLKLLENELHVDEVTEFSVFEETTKRIVKELFVENINLNESTMFDSPNKVFEKTIAASYRATREAVEELDDFGKMKSNAATLQARRMLHMKPQVLNGNMADIKALAIRLWNQTLEQCLKEQLLNEYGLAREAAEDKAKEYLGKNKLHLVKDHHTIDSVLQLGKAVKRHHMKTANSAYRVVKYNYKDKIYVVIEAPGKKPEVYE